MHIISYCPKTSNQKNPTGDRFIFACKMWINEQLFVKNHFTWSTLDSFSSPVITWTSFRSTLLSRFAWYSRADSSSVCPVRAADKPIKYVHVNHFFCSIHLTLAVISFNISNNHPAAVVQGLTNNITPKLETWFVSQDTCSLCFIIHIFLLTISLAGTGAIAENHSIGQVFSKDQQWWCCGWCFSCPRRSFSSFCNTL